MTKTGYILDELTSFEVMQQFDIVHQTTWWIKSYDPGFEKTCVQKETQQHICNWFALWWHHDTCTFRACPCLCAFCYFLWNASQAKFHSFDEAAWKCHHYNSTRVYLKKTNVPKTWRDHHDMKQTHRCQKIQLMLSAVITAQRSHRYTQKI